MKFGYNRDGKRGHEQIVMGLLRSDGGCPVGVKVCAGIRRTEKRYRRRCKRYRRNMGQRKLSWQEIEK